MSTLSTNFIQSLAGKRILNTTGGILQVQQTLIDTTFSTTTLLASGGAAVTGLSVSITPTSATNKILLFCILNCSSTAAVTQAFAWLARGTTKIGAGAQASNRIGTGGRYYYNDNNVSGIIPMSYLDSPGVTTPVTYNVYVATESASGSVFVNRTPNDTDNTTNGSRQSSILIAMEVVA